MLRCHATSGEPHPLGVVLPGDALLDGKPYHLVHGAPLTFRLLPQQGGLLVGEPECHGHVGMIPPCHHQTGAARAVATIGP
jgi:hypothetical protein